LVAQELSEISILIHKPMFLKLMVVVTSFVKKYLLMVFSESMLRNFIGESNALQQITSIVASYLLSMLAKLAQVEYSILILIIESHIANKKRHPSLGLQEL
jgi:hypothetical protein